MGMRERDIEEQADKFASGQEFAVTGQIASDRYSAGSSAVEIALVLFEKHGIEMVRKFQESLSASEDMN